MDPAGVFATSFTQDQALVRTRRQAVTLVLFVLAMFSLPFVADARAVAVMTSMLITAVVVIGLQINTGLAGQINMGQAAFMGVGAYATALLATKGGLPFWLALPAGGVCAALFGLVFGLAAVRIKGFYLALTTIAAQILFHFMVLNMPAAWLGGSNGITVEAARLFGLVLDTDTGVYYLCLVVACIMIAGAYGVARSRHGRIFAAVRDDDVASGMMGINVVRTKALAFLLGAFYAGIGGGLWAYYVRFVSIDQFTLIHSIWFIAMIIVGGMGSVTGALIGVFVIRLAQESFTSVGPSLVESFSFLSGDVVFAAMNIFLGGIIAGFLIFEPRGLMHRWNILKRSYRMWPYPY
ncbi:MAG: branched-chain amino acid ABC transporter permease [Hydrogenophaga sp.]|jgi:branched-chain amino acid transport system permease protein|uniref:Branched-chain amino acid ABC transporter permease n=2 Tax=Hydrogenophaga borbori TaxID=2294117 RepID=A0A372EKH0_9BURK|nr:MULTISPECIES: branched-chain amino acid ABC transporter permease [unclassified Hydrogenophaga]MBN9410292.1 branched-chain amino acid ABC transporter permease [Burkholderiales bacterium]NCT97932.1 branched-chain amino acid ABC transporter permease [Comamonadaceae bacterium]RFP79404.1 branched-chain amino acid ABC transporter permease [Hydrogenophaga borbori]MBN9371883.1 branched-chain amino acid ABC transporter permease [Hydrogenophaga sp.]MBX3609587.1 branched-chain amino acid ABC transport